MWRRVKLGHNTARVCEERVGGGGEKKIETGRNESREDRGRPGPQLVSSDCCLINKGEKSVVSI